MKELNEVCCFSPVAGKLVLTKVSGETAAQNIPENDTQAASGSERSMYFYVPQSACFDAKQTAVFMILRAGSDQASAEEVLERYQLAQLAEEHHFILLLPNPAAAGWNYQETTDADNDLEFLKRCFVSLSQSAAGVAGFNGMLFYLATCPSASALLTTFSARSPLDTAGIMISEYPADYQIPQDGLQAPQVVYLNQGNAAAKEYFEQVNGPLRQVDQNNQRTLLVNTENPNLKWYDSVKELDASEVQFAWQELFTKTRRWRNAPLGTYQKRTDFAARGFVGHVETDELNLADNRKATWYEYLPPQLRNSQKLIPVVFYFHGIGCVPLYGAEQSGWHDIADQEEFLVIYPKPLIEKRWNVWDDPRLPSDVAFILTLLEELKQRYPIDPTRIYLSGFSMGSMMVNALAAAYPDIFAAAAPCNAPHLGYLQTLDEMKSMLLGMNPQSCVKELPEQAVPTISPIRALADEKKQRYDYFMPVIQNHGLQDLMWSFKEAKGYWQQTFDYWKSYNGIPLKLFEVTEDYESGMIADENSYEGTDQRFLHQKWYSEKAPWSLYEVVFAKEMAHALDLRQLEIAWQFMKDYSREPSGKLICIRE